MSDKLYTVAVIGGGPRGLAALESLYEKLVVQSLPYTVKTVLFEPSQFPGGGPIYAPDQSPGNWLNIPGRLVDIEARSGLLSGQIPGFPSYREWAGLEDEDGNEKRVDQYPQRAVLGKYLTARFNSLAENLVACGWLTVIHSEVERIVFDGEHATITCENGQLTEVDEVVLTIGHQPVEPDPSLVSWKAYMDCHPGFTLISDPYPTTQITSHKAIDSESTVAIRGFGLSMIDVVKGLTEARGGRFVMSDERTRAMTYQPSGHEPRRMIPFSLDGLPLVPKPLNASVDMRFDPDLSLKHEFEVECSRLAAAQSGASNPLHELIELVSVIQVRQFLSLGNSARTHSESHKQLLAIARQWLADAEFDHDLIVSSGLPTETAMRTCTGMACEQEPFSFDYCLGQVWRHLQFIMFKCLSHTALCAESVRDIVNLHERMKRYSYGPPVDSMQRLIALSKCGLLSFVVVDDPDIKLTQDGWRFHSEQTSICADVMINSVLASPDLEKISSPLIRQLRRDHSVVPVSNSLGVLTARDGLVLNDHRETSVPLAILGRLAKGSLIGTDSLTGCFDERRDAWSESLLGRLSSRL